MGNVNSMAQEKKHFVGEPQDAWSEIYNSGIDTGEKRTTITTQYEVAEMSGSI